MVAILLAVLAFALMVFSLTQKRLLWGVIGVGAYSLVLASLYLVLAAPDVALTEAAVGFGLVTFIYLLAARRTGKLVVVASPLFPCSTRKGNVLLVWNGRSLSVLLAGVIGIWNCCGCPAQRFRAC